MEENLIDKAIANMTDFERWKLAVKSKLAFIWWKTKPDNPKRIAIERLLNLINLANSPSPFNLEPIFRALRSLGEDQLIPSMDIINEWYKGDF
jgi:hypothetical protein